MFFLTNQFRLNLIIYIFEQIKINMQNTNTFIPDAIERIEEKSNIEIVLVKNKKSSNYNEISFMWGTVFMLIGFTYLMFTKAVFGNYLFYLLTLFTFLLGYTIGFLLEKQSMFLVRKKIKNQAVETEARAIFQKAGIYKTNKHTGMLIYISENEKKSFIVADLGVESLISEEILQNIENEFDKTLKSSSKDENIAKVLEKFANTFSKYIPKTQDDANELPNELKIVI